MTVVAEEQVESQSEIVQWVTFSLGAEHFGVQVMQVQEVLRVSEIAPVPGSPGHVLGIINLRGKVVSVIDARARFGLDTGELTDASRIVIIEVKNQVAGLLVDSVAEVANLSAQDVEPPPKVAADDSAGYIQGVANRADHGLLILVDLNRLLSTDEWSALEGL